MWCRDKSTLTRTGTKSMLINPGESYRVTTRLEYSRSTNTEIGWKNEAKFVISDRTGSFSSRLSKVSRKLTNSTRVWTALEHDSLSMLFLKEGANGKSKEGPYSGSELAYTSTYEWRNNKRIYIVNPRCVQRFPAHTPMWFNHSSKPRGTHSETNRVNQNLVLADLADGFDRKAFTFITRRHF